MVNSAEPLILSDDFFTDKDIVNAKNRLCKEYNKNTQNHANYLLSLGGVFLALVVGIWNLFSANMYLGIIMLSLAIFPLILTIWLLLRNRYWNIFSNDALLMTKKRMIDSFNTVNQYCVYYNNGETPLSDAVFQIGVKQVLIDKYCFLAEKKDLNWSDRWNKMAIETGHLFPKINNSKLKVTKKTFIFFATVLVLVLTVGTVFFTAYSNGQMTTWDIIAKDEQFLRDVYSNQTQSKFRDLLPNNQMNFTDGLIWQSGLVKFDMNRPPFENVLQVLENGKGACGENVWVYAAFCVAKDIPFRVVTVGYFIPNVVDHAWIQVNPSGDGKTWIQIDVADTCAGLQNGKTIDELWNQTLNNNSYYAGKQYKMVLAFELNEQNEITITDVTGTFS